MVVLGFEEATFFNVMVNGTGRNGSLDIFDIFKLGKGIPVIFYSN